MFTPAHSSWNSREEAHAASAAFTRTDLLCALMALALLVIAFAPAFANDRSHSSRAVCMNNLRHLGSAMHQWMGDRNVQQPPWWIPLSAGGTSWSPKPGNAWFELISFTNELPSPKFLACPADSGARAAQEWVQYRSLRQLATSYALGADAALLPPSHFLAGDLNIRFDGGPVNCSAGFNNVDFIDGVPWTNAGWTNAVHGESGHVLHIDGAVEFTSTARLREIFLSPDDGSRIHVLRAR